MYPPPKLFIIVPSAFFSSCNHLNLHTYVCISMYILVLSVFEFYINGFTVFYCNWLLLLRTILKIHPSLGHLDYSFSFFAITMLI